MDIDKLKILNQDEVNELYKMLAHLVKTLDKYCIPYLVDCGSLLGTIRHGGLIPWDDDIDICIEEKDVPQVLWLKSIIEGEYQLRYASGKKYLKLKKDNLWIDIFIHKQGVYPQKHRQWRNFVIEEAFPSVKSKFGDIEVSVPKNYKKLLDDWFPKWESIAVVHHSHKSGKSRKSKCLKLELTEELKKPYLPILKPN